MGWGNHHSGHKANYHCPQNGCTYHSRKFISWASAVAMKNHSHSDLCPIHRQQLIYIGGKTLPTTKTKRGRKARKILIERFKKFNK
ncbi:hypothetical protein [Flavobacterium sp.]|uniref:hypothetical protein n=1 Tax=Flavobacterium sp. TaxID=239 RepID=UPI002625F90A|nr:hypothetical protein [Flavobacterium sp.]